MNISPLLSIPSAATARLIVLLLALGSLPVYGIEYNLVGNPNYVEVPGDPITSGTALFSNYILQPAGTGVFKPFLGLDANGNPLSTGMKYTEEAFNTDGHTALYMDAHRPEWNNLLRMSELATIKINNINYFGFILDANEPGNLPDPSSKRLLSIDNIRIYTSPNDTSAAGGVGPSVNTLDSLGTLRWAMNDPTKNPDGSYAIDTWVKIDAGQELTGNANGGSGQGDMVVYIPQSAFGASLATNDYVWFYNLNGVHNKVVSSDLGAQAGYEEWRAIVGPQTNVPDGGTTVVLVGSALAAIGFVSRRRRAA